MKVASLSIITALALTSHLNAMDYEGICEASAGAYLTPTHFVVASDETNRLQMYERGKPAPVSIIDLKSFTGHDKSDLEGAAIIRDRVYWISSHSYNKNREDKRKRKILFATDIMNDDGRVSLVGVPNPVGNLGDPLVKAAGIDPAEIDIEGLAATEDGQLLIGFRAPLRDGKALAIRLANPGEVIGSRAAPAFGEPLWLDLGGRGIRSLERVGSGPHPYLIMAGPVVDASEGFALFWWSGTGKEVIPASAPELKSMIPEALMAIPGTSTIQVLSDAGDGCRGSDEDPPDTERKFRSIEFER